MSLTRIPLLLVLAVFLLPACSLGGGNLPLEDGEIRYGPAATPAEVDCADSDAFDDLEDFEDLEAVQTCEVVFKDGTGSETVCQASQGTDKPGRLWPGTCEAAAAAYRG
jgi:hypothetical protein